MFEYLVDGNFEYKWLFSHFSFRTALKDTVTTLSSLFNSLFEKEGEQSSLKPSPRLERLLLLAKLLSQLLIPQPLGSGGVTEDPAKIKANTTPTALLIGKEVFGPNDNSYFSKCVETCLNIVRCLHSRLQRGDENQDPEAVDHEASTISRRLPFLTTGLYQCSRGVNFSSLTYGFASGLTNSAPLLDAQTCLNKLEGALYTDFEIQVTESAVLLAIALFSARGSDEIGSEYRRTWCNVSYDLIELLTSAELGQAEELTSTTGESQTTKTLNCTSSGAKRLAGLIRSVSFFDYFCCAAPRISILSFLFFECIYQKGVDMLWDFGWIILIATEI